jgi:hypothetical protein
MLGVVFLCGDRGPDGTHGRRKPDVRRGVAGASSGADAEDAMDCCVLASEIDLVGMNLGVGGIMGDGRLYVIWK